MGGSRPDGSAPGARPSAWTPGLLRTAAALIGAVGVVLVLAHTAPDDPLLIAVLLTLAWAVLLLPTWLPFDDPRVWLPAAALAGLPLPLLTWRATRAA